MGHILMNKHSSKNALKLVKKCGIKFESVRSNLRVIWKVKWINLLSFIWDNRKGKHMIYDGMDGVYQISS